MSIFNPVARALWGGGGNGQELELENKALKEQLAEERLYSHPFERITEAGRDVLGDYVFVSGYYSSNPSTTSGYYRLKPNVKNIANLQVTYGESYDLTEMTPAVRRVLNDGSYSNISVANCASRLIFPEVLPNAVDSSGNPLINTIPNFVGVPPVSCYLPKHTANNANNSDWIAGNTPAAVKEHIVVAPVGMDAPLHLHKFTLMSADTIVAILQNLADVSDRATPPTLTLGSSNLAKLTDAQIAIAEQKGWNLA